MAVDHGPYHVYFNSINRKLDPYCFLCILRGDQNHIICDCKYLEVNKLRVMN